MPERRVLVTGGTGFIGSHLARRLCRDGWCVHVLHRPGGEAGRIADLRPAVTAWECDLRDPARLGGVLRDVRPEVIYHVAGDTGVRHVDQELAGVTRSVEGNLIGSLNLLVAARAHGRDLVDFIRLGGLEEYGRGPVPYEEEQREQPVSPYSASQVAVTHYLQMLAPHLPYRVTTVRPALVYGPGQSTAFLIPSLIEHCLRGEDFPLSAGRSGRDLLYVDDLIEMLCLLRDMPRCSGEIFNAGSGREYLMADVAAAILRLAGTGNRITPNAASRPSEVEHLYCSTRKTGERLGWKPVVELEEGLARTIDWFRRRAN